MEIVSPPECSVCGDRAQKISITTQKYFCSQHWGGMMEDFNSVKECPMCLGTEFIKRYKTVLGDPYGSLICSCDICGYTWPERTAADQRRDDG